MSLQPKGLLGTTIELIYSSVDSQDVAELFRIIERIIKLTDTASYNREALPFMKSYMMEVMQTIYDNTDTVNQEYIPSLIMALNSWEKFLAQYTKPKMK